MRPLRRESSEHKRKKDIHIRELPGSQHGGIPHSWTYLVGTLVLEEAISVSSRYNSLRFRARRTRFSPQSGSFSSPWDISFPQEARSGKNEISLNDDSTPVWKGKGRTAVCKEHDSCFRRLSEDSKSLLLSPNPAFGLTFTFSPKKIYMYKKVEIWRVDAFLFQIGWRTLRLVRLLTWRSAIPTRCRGRLEIEKGSAKLFFRGAFFCLSSFHVEENVF